MVIYKIHELIIEHGKNPYRIWLATLDLETRARIQARILRMEMGNLGDYKALGSGLYEARLHLGPGYRIYYAFEDRDRILLIGGGVKKRQTKDVSAAKSLWFNYRSKGKD